MRSKLVFFLCGILLLSAPGCWDVRDVNNTAFAVSMGIDQPAKQSNKYKVTLEFAEPVSGKPTPRSLITSAEGNSILQAVQRIQTSISRTISFSHLRVLVVGEEMAKHRDFQDLANYLMKNPEVALRLRLLFVQGDEAGALFEVKPKYSELLAAELVAMGQLQQELSLVRTNNFYNFWLDIKSNKGIALGSRAVLKEGKKSFVREGAAIYKDWKLSNWLNDNEAQAANWLIEKTRAIVVAEEGQSSYTYQISKQKVKITPKVERGKVTFLVKVTTIGMVMEETGAKLDFSEEKNLRTMEVLFAKAIKRQIESAVDKSQHELATDYLGFGQALKQHQPETFKSLNWPEVFPTVLINVEVDCKVKSSGLQT